MRLWEYVGKNIELTLIDGSVYKGFVSAFDDEIDNESQEDSIDFKDRDGIWSIGLSEIKSIKEL